MQKNLLTCLLLSGAAVASAAVPETSGITVAPTEQIMVSAAPAKAAPRALSTKKISDAPVRMLDFNGMNFKKLDRPATTKSIKPQAKQRRAAEAGANGVLLYESFENPGDDANWLPEGWTQISYSPEDLGEECHWGAVESSWMLGATDGDWMAMVSFSYDDLTAEQDEWLISPEVEIPDEGEYNLSFDMYASGLFFYSLDPDNFSFELWDFINRVKLYTVEVLVSADGGEYEKVFDLEEQYADFDIDELLELDGFRSYEVSLAEYAGKAIKVAFRFVGHECNSTAVDAVKIALPSLDLEISPDFGMEYYGTSSDALFGSLTSGVGLLPVYSPFTFFNDSYNEGASYTWHYTDPTTYEWATVEDEDELVLEYEPDYSTDFSKTNNLVYPPYLTGVAEGYTEGEVQFPNLMFMQVGGTPSWPANETTMSFGAIPFNVNDTKVGMYTVEDYEQGDVEVPIFGHNPSTNQWWTNYTFEGDAGEGDFAEVDAILNFIYTVPGSSLVFDKVWLHAFGMFDDDVEFTCGVYPIDPDTYEPAEEPMVTATITGADVLSEPQTSYNLVSLVFDFDEPVVFDGDEGCYIVKISGFNSDKVEFFAPFQQWRPGMLALGWIEKTISWSGITGQSFSPIAYFENDYGEMYCAFDIELGAWYPWLKSDDEVLDLGEDCDGTISLATYYDGADLTITASDWIEATAAGRYDECAVSVKAQATAEAREGFVTVSAPGVEALTFKVSQGVTSGISSIASGAKREVKSAVTPAGVAADLSVPGIYIVTYTDGTVEKKAVK